MNQVKSIFSLLIVVMLTVSLGAQDLKQHIPKNAFFVVEFNTKKMSNKVDFDKLKQYDFMKMMESEMGNESEMMREVYNNPEKHGLSANTNYYMYGTNTDGMMNINTIFEIADKAKFENMVKESMGADSEITKSQSAKQFKYITSNQSAVGWNDKCAIISIASESTPEPVTGMPDEEIMEAPPAVMEAPAVDELEVEPEMDIKMPANVSPKLLASAKAGLMSAFSNKANNSILADPKFVAANLKGHDIQMWMNYENGMPGRGSEMMNMPGIPPQMKPIMENMYNGYIIDVGMDFNNGQVDIISNTHMAGDMAKIFNSATKQMPNKNFAKYIGKEDLLGYFSLHYNIGNTINTLKDVFSPMKEEIADAESGFNSMLSSFGMGMDANDVYNLIRGDMVVAMTGMREFEKEVITYEYDDDFNRKEIKKMVKNSLPEFVMLMAYDNAENVQKVIDMGKNMGMLTQNENFYNAAVPGSPMDLNIAMSNGMLVISNNVDLMKPKTLKKGLKRKKRIGKNHQKDLLLNSQTFFWDIPATIKMAEAAFPKDDPTMNKIMKATEDSVESFQINTSKMVGNKLVSKGKIGFKNKKINSIEQFFNLLNELSLISESGMRM